MESQRDKTLRLSGVGNVFIKNLNKNIKSKDLLDVFIEFGKISSCHITIDDKGISKGYGFIQFQREEEACEAIAKLNGMLFNDKKV
jgi:polyadenylate-binding protein